jgi:hypothetical protein
VIQVRAWANAKQPGVGLAQLVFGSSARRSCGVRAGSADKVQRMNKLDIDTGATKKD